MNDKQNDGLISRFQVLVLVVLRIAIGWHFLYEGVSKILTPNWTSAPYLENSKWILADLFHAVAANPTALRGVDLLNMWGLTLIGLALIVGCLTRLAGLAGILLLALYYVANPPFISTGFGVPVEGHYLIVNKNLVEMVALALLMAFGAGRYWGWDRIWMCVMQRALAKRTHDASDPGEAVVGAARLDVRPVLGGIGPPARMAAGTVVAGVAGYAAPAAREIGTVADGAGAGAIGGHFGAVGRGGDPTRLDPHPGPDLQDR